MEKKMLMLGPTNNLKVLIKEANDLLIKKEDIVDIVTIPNGYILIYFG